MSDEPKKIDAADSRWQPVAVVSLQVEPKRPPARSLKNAVWDIGGCIVLGVASWAGISFLTPDRRLNLWMAAWGVILGLAIGLANWLRRPIAR
jgi:hypothetical protein